jgi:hypothetical protein
MKRNLAIENNGKKRKKSRMLVKAGGRAAPVSRPQATRSVPGFLSHACVSGIVINGMVKNTYDERMHGRLKEVPRVCHRAKTENRQMHGG